jgi:hypothetical protein
VLAESLTRFGAIIHGARFNLNSLMGACVDQIEKFDAEGDVAGGLSTGWKTYRGIVDLVTAGPTESRRAAAPHHRRSRRAHRRNAAEVRRRGQGPGRPVLDGDGAGHRLSGPP